MIDGECCCSTSQPRPFLHLARCWHRYVEAVPEGRSDRLPDLLAALVRGKVDVLFSPRPEIILAAKQATRTVPIVFAAVGDPVGAGLVESIGRPGARSNRQSSSRS
jgi:hypothetical protein